VGAFGAISQNPENWVPFSVKWAGYGTAATPNKNAYLSPAKRPEMCRWSLGPTRVCRKGKFLFGVVSPPASIMMKSSKIGGVLTFYPPATSVFI
jgi:hypothetical protein